MKIIVCIVLSLSKFLFVQKNSCESPSVSNNPKNPTNYLIFAVLLALFLKLLGTSKLSYRDPDFYEVGTLSTQNRDPKVPFEKIPKIRTQKVKKRCLWGPGSLNMDPIISKCTIMH